MNSGEYLSIQPQELQFPFELNKQIPCTMQLTNHTDCNVAFKVKTTNPKKYSVRPNTGIVLPHSNHDLLVTMQAQKEAPADLQCKDKFLLQSVIASPGLTVKDITSDMFNKESGNYVDEWKLKVSYIAPPQPPMTVQEGSDEGSVSDNGNMDTFSPATRTHVEPEDDSLQVDATISRLMEEKNSAIQQNNKLHQEMELLRREISKKCAGIPFMYVIVVGIIGIILGYLVKKI
ncbi:vesicle-associated protein 1-2-like [Chenopodium quinoa]|uniref:MSP domain-containing protein n=1 Tax=Chenopodium quinoa TaxID=63459 RepID=A0A803LI66_CHEQI|nr:vesicle-associated protein 1-2-like [Chenopodium quinoa]